MIYGVGIDTIEVDRVKRFLLKQEGLRNQIFSQAEIKYCESKTNRAQSYAARFAAKEAFLKALGTGLNGRFPLREIEVVNLKFGRPELVLKNKAKRMAEIKRIKRIGVSLSHLKQVASAIVVLER